MKKCLLSLLLAFALLCGFLPISGISVHAYSKTDIAYPVEGGNIYFDKTSGSITDCDSSVTAADIPAEIDGVTVTSILYSAFSGCSSLGSVTIPWGITSIGSHAFYECSSLISVAIPDSVMSIGECAFFGCSGLTSISIPNGVMSIEKYTFEKCSSLTDVTIPNSVTSIDDGAFSFCNSLTDVTIPNSVTSIGYSVFYRCSSLTSVTIPSSVNWIGDSAFADCASLTGIFVDKDNPNYSSDAVGVLYNKYKTELFQCPGGYIGKYSISDSVTCLSSYAFSGCARLTCIMVDEDNPSYSSDAAGILFIKDKSKLLQCPGGYIGEYTIPNSVTSIAPSAFQGCSGLTDVTIPDSVTSIGSYAFEGTSVYFSEKLWVDDVLYIGNWLIDAKDSITGAYIIRTGTRGIADRAFYNCSSLTSVTIPDSVRMIGDSVFAWCGLTSVTIPNSVTTIGDYAFYCCKSLTGVTIPDSVTSIGYSAFNGCSSLTDVMIPDSVTSIGTSAFDDTKIYSSEDLWIDGVLYIGNWLIEARTSGAYAIRAGTLGIADRAFQRRSRLTSVTIPDSVTSIGNYAFNGCSSLTSVTIPNNVTSIGDSTFYGCSSLTSVTLPDSVTMIGDSAFSECSSLTDMTIPDSVTMIGDSAFNGCSSLTDMAIPDSVTMIGDSAFNWCSSLTSVTIPDSVTSLADSTFSFCSSLTSVTIPDSVTSIGECAFLGCSGLMSITIPDSVTSIGRSAFSRCSSLTSITIPDSVTSIGDSVFSDCSSLTSITIPNSVTSIGDSAFSWCSSLTDVTIPDSVTSIGDSTFSWCRSLTSVTIPDSVTSIENFAFSFCDSLASVTLPDNVTTIGDNAFLLCSSLTSVIIPNSVTTIGDSAFCACTSLSSVYFTGDAPTTFFENAFKVWDDETETLINIPGLTLYYIEGKEGWTSPTWNGYPTATWMPVHEHTYTETVTAPTCTEQGYTTHICSVCGDSYVDTYVDALGHDFGEWTQMKAPTCTEKGSEKRACSRCDTFETREIDALGHKYENGVCVQCGEKDPNEQPTIEFVDVPQKAWYVDAVNYAVQNGLMNGVGNDQFNPEGSMTRAMLVTVLWRYEGEPEAGENTISDIPNGQWYTNAVAWAAENGIVGGVGNNRFDPNGEITREQMATILFRYARKKGINTSKRGDLSGFPDANTVSDYAKAPVQWAVAEKIINGSDGKLLPQGNATRAQVSAILMRFIENNVK